MSKGWGVVGGRGVSVEKVWGMGWGQRRTRIYHAAESTPTLIRVWDLIGSLSCPSASQASHRLQKILLASYESTEFEWYLIREY